MLIWPFFLEFNPLVSFSHDINHSRLTLIDNNNILVSERYISNTYHSFIGIFSLLYYCLLGYGLSPLYVLFVIRIHSLTCYRKLTKNLKSVKFLTPMVMLSHFLFRVILSHRNFSTFLCCQRSIICESLQRY